MDIHCQLRRFVCDTIPVPTKLNSSVSISISGCFQNGKDYAGSDIYSSLFWTSNAERCQKLCQNDNDCEYWTWIWHMKMMVVMVHGI